MHPPELGRGRTGSSNPRLDTQMTPTTEDTAPGLQRSSLDHPDEMEDCSCDVLVIGAGISGAAFLDWTQGQDVLVCEASNRVGGHCSTYKTDGFTWDKSGHFFHFRDPVLERQLIERVGAGEVVRLQKKSAIYWREALVDYPFQKHIDQLPFEDFLECLRGLGETTDGAPTDLHDMFFKRYGAGIAGKFLVPYNEKVYGTDLRRLDPDAMGRFMPAADVKSILSGLGKGSSDDSYNAHFVYPKAGAVRFVEALIGGNADRVLLGEPVLRVCLSTRTATTSLRRISFRILVSTVALPKTLALCGIPYENTLYRWSDVMVANMGFEEGNTFGQHWIYFPQPEIPFYRVGFYNNITDEQRLSLYVEMGVTSGPASRSIQAWADVAVEWLKTVGIVPHGAARIAEKLVLMSPGYVHLGAGVQRSVAEAKEVLGRRNVHTVGRYGSWRYCSIEDCILEARELATELGMAVQ